MSTARSERFREVDAIFDAVLDAAPDEREAIIVQACGDDLALRAEVQALLDAFGRSVDFLESPAVELGAALLEDSPLAQAASVPDHVGPFRIVRELGHGGMGVVYLAEREGAEFQQRVALKLVRHFGGGEAMKRRFLEERRILALLEHPGIARLIDGGVTDSLPWFAMELVEGEPIDSYCDTRQLDIDQRLDLFSAVCDAVQYAHEHLIIHRDLKPSNILVNTDGQLKLLDFGIAKLLDPLHAPDDAESRTGLVALTPEYAAPEQVRGQTVSTATDTYALGILLYALLTGRRPYDVSGRTPAEVERIVCEVEPPRPSMMYAAALAAAPDGRDAVVRARARASTPEKLRRRLSGDLDVIVMKALHKETSRRYSSAASLREDLRRFRSGLSVLARPDTVGYRTRKFIGRNRVAVIATGVIAMLLTAYGATVLRDRQRIRRALVEAEAGTRKAEQVTDFMLGLFQAAEGGKALTDTVTARELLSRGLIQTRELTAQPELQAQMLDVIGRLHLQLGDYNEAQPLLEEALTMRRKLYGEAHPDVVTSMANLANVLEGLGDDERAIDLRQNVLATRRRLNGDADRKTIDALSALARLLYGSGKSAEAKPLADEWLAQLAKRASDSSAWHADQLMSAAGFVQTRGATDQADSMYREAFEIRRSLFGERHHLVAQTLFRWGSLLDVAQRFDEAEPLLRNSVDILRSVYPQGHPLLGNALRMHGVMLLHEQRFAEAHEPLRASLEIRRRLSGANTIDVAVVELDLAYALIMSGVYDEAEALSRDAIRIFRTELGAENSMVFHANTHLGEALRGQGRHREAEPLLLATYRRFDPPKPITARWRRHALAALIRLYEASARPAEAAKYRDLLTASLPTGASANPQRSVPRH